MGLLAAVAIPAYNNYRRTAQAGSITATQSQISKAFASCLAVNPFGTCSTADINNTLMAQGGIRIYSNQDALKQNSCYGIELGGVLGTVAGQPGMPDYSGCVAFDNDNTGAVSLQATGAPIGSPCQGLQPIVTCSGGMAETSPGAGDGANGTPADNCSTFGCMAGTTHVCPQLAGNQPATTTGNCAAGGNTNKAVVVACMGDGECN